ncbi:glycosyltransferase family 2 protein [bacterium]|nr:glycosyltransferase family 2 protein [bacterium]
MEDIKISIITASYNYENYIKETIESVLAQTYQNWEMIIVDDGSKDNSVEVIKGYCEKDNRIKFYQHENGENKGLCKTVQYGIEKAQSEWLAFLESDDIITPDYLQEKVNVIEKNPEINFIFNDIETFGDRASAHGYEEYFEKQKSLISKLGNPADYFDAMGENNFVPTFSIVMTKKSIMQSLEYTIKGGEPQLDWFLWRQIALNHKFYYIDKKLTKWRLHKNSYISTPIPEIRTLLFEYSYYKLSLKRGNPFKHLPKLLKTARRCIFRLRLKQKKFLLFGKWYDLNKKESAK